MTNSEPVGVRLIESPLALLVWWAIALALLVASANGLLA